MPKKQSTVKIKQETAAEWVAIDSVKPWSENPRNHIGNVKQLQNLIKRFGWTTPMVARRENGELIEGHGRLLAAKALGMERVPVRFVDLTEEQAHLAAVAANRSAEKSEWDESFLTQILQQFDEVDRDLAGFSVKEWEAMVGITKMQADAASDDSTLIEEGLAVVVQCVDDKHQREVLELCAEKAWECRALI